ncbi:MAG: hypothetical protein PHI06_05670 [Desulfobulbaceae bacterium]|nr:hypothetical protein [Desulfobulbaceae bacterium]
MKEPLEIVIHKNGLALCHPTDCTATEFVARDEKGVALRIVDFISRVNAHPAHLHLFVSEDLLFFKSFDLPPDTMDVEEAVGYQLEMVTPFADEATWHSFAVQKDDAGYHVTLYAAQSGYIDAYIQEILEAGIQLSGLYPESQRYVNKLNRKSNWGLILPGRYIKAFIFAGPIMVDRQYCSSEPSFGEAVEVCKSETIFKLDPAKIESQPVVEALPPKPYFDYLDACTLLTQRPHLKTYNMLPASYQRPDYLKIMIGVLLVVNVLTFLLWGGVKLYTLKKYNTRVNRQIEEIMPLVTEMKNLRQQEEDSLKAIAQIEGIGKNFDLIQFLQQLTTAMPADSYVDQLRLDEQTNVVSIQGYTDEVSALTTKLQEIGAAQLKSTSRRQNKTYFNVEVSLP